MSDEKTGMQMLSDDAPSRGEAEVLSLWVVTANPKDFPGKFVARETLLGPHGRHRVSEACFVADTLEHLREMLPEGLHRMARWAEDDPVIVEVWL